MLSITEFSEITGIKQSTLRYYDEIGLFSPVARGRNDYRYYAPQQIISINLINVLTGLGVSLNQISDMVRNRTPGSLISLLNQQENKLDAELRRLHRSYSVIHLLRSQMQRGLMVDESKISVRAMEGMSISLGPQNDYENGGSFYEAFLNFCEYARRLRINMSYPIGDFFTDMESFQKDPSKPSRLFAIDPEGSDTKPAGLFIIGYTRSFYGQAGDIGDRITAYADENHLTLNGPVYGVRLHDELSMRDPDSYLLKVMSQVHSE